MLLKHEYFYLWLMKKGHLATILLFLFFNTTKAQLGKEAWHWQFGDSCTIEFSTGTPVVGPSSSISTREGCASISDINTGQLLFYTDGTYVWDRNNNFMPNGYGLLGDVSSSQSALIVPKPGSTNLYYLFTVPAQAGAFSGHSAANYSIVDMTLNGGLGDIDTANKNKLLNPNVCEKQTAVKHCNGRDYWIINHSFNSKKYNAYLLTSSGLSLVPVVSTIGNNIGPNGDFNSSAAGYLKASPNGKKLATTLCVTNIIELYDFNSSTGQLSNLISIPCAPVSVGYGGCYGLSFSPDNSKLYTTIETSGELYQYDISSGISSSIIASATLISLGPQDDYDALQLGPDGKIYVANNLTHMLSRIDNPNATGAACNYAPNIFTFSSTCMLGLPNFIDANNNFPLSNPVVPTINFCNNFLADTLKAGVGFTNYLWSTGDTTSITLIHTPGKYWLTATNQQGCTITDTTNVTIQTPPVINVVKDTSVCSNMNSYSININATYPNTVSYKWNDGFTQPARTIVNPGQYSITYVLTNSCIATDSFNFSIDSIPAIYLGRDTSLCKPYILKANANEIYQWSNGAATQQTTVTQSGTYFIQVTSPQGCKNSDTVSVLINTPPIINVLKDTFECGNVLIPYNVNAFYPNTIAYNWSDGFSGQTHTINSPGNYWIAYSFSNTCVSLDSFNVFLHQNPVVDIGADTTFCTGNLVLNAYNNGSTYLWNTGENTATIIAIKPNKYWVTVNNNGCLNSDTLNISPDLKQLDVVIPNIVTPNNDNINDYIDFSKYHFSNIRLNIYNRWGLKIFETEDINCIWKTNYEDGTYFYDLQYQINCGSESQTKNLKGFLTVIR